MDQKQAGRAASGCWGMIAIAAVVIVVCVLLYLVIV